MIIFVGQSEKVFDWIVGGSPLIITECKLEQPEKASIPIVLTDEPMVAVVNPVHC